MLLLLLTIFSIIQAEEVDREKYMPPKKSKQHSEPLQITKKYLITAYYNTK